MKARFGEQDQAFSSQRPKNFCVGMAMKTPSKMKPVTASKALIEL
jgi:hypothetical protein